MDIFISFVDGEFRVLENCSSLSIVDNELLGKLYCISCHAIPLYFPVVAVDIIEVL